MVILLLTLLSENNGLEWQELQVLMLPVFRPVFLRTVIFQNPLQSGKRLVKPTKGGKVGLGGYVFNDNNGIMRRTGCSG